MSERNVEVVRKLHEAFSEQGFASDAALVHFDESLVFEEPPEQPAPRTAHGLAEAVELFSQFDDAWAEHRSETEQITAVGDDRVLVLSTEHFRGRDGLEISQPCASLYTLREGKVVRAQAFWEQATGLRAAGLAE